jgi:hypothetical protein
LEELSESNTQISFGPFKNNSFWSKNISTLFCFCFLVVANIFTTTTFIPNEKTFDGEGI